MKVLVTQTQNWTGQAAFYIATKKHTLNDGLHAFLGLKYAEYFQITRYLIPIPSEENILPCAMYCREQGKK